MRPSKAFLRCVAILASAIFCMSSSVNAEGLLLQMLPFQVHPQDDAYGPAIAICDAPCCCLFSVDDYVDHARDSATRLLQG
jgi:hypothetical protein